MAVSHVRSKKVVAYEVVEGPPLAFSLGSAGALTASGQTLIGGLESAASLADGLQDSDLIEGGVVANGTAENLPSGALKTLILKDQVRVVGEAKTSGSWGVEGPDVKIEPGGGVTESSEQEDLPQIDIAKYDPGDKAVAHAQTAVSDVAPVYGFHRYANPSDPAYAVTFMEEVDLQGALIYVDGDVILEKPLKGTGALVATGNVTLRGGADMKADALAAVVAGGDLTVSGTKGVASLFTGLLYAGGNLALSNTRTVGAAIAAGTAEGGSLMSIVDSEVFSSPEGADVAIVIEDAVTRGPKSLDDLYGDDKGSGPGGADAANKPIIEPVAADLFVNGRFVQEDETDQQVRERVGKFVKILYNHVTYDSPTDLPPSTERDQIEISYNAAVNKWVQKAKDLQAQQNRKPVEIVRFDLNEFLNVNDRLRSSRMFYIEG